MQEQPPLILITCPGSNEAKLVFRFPGLHAASLPATNDGHRHRNAAAKPVTRTVVATISAAVAATISASATMPVASASMASTSMAPTAVATTPMAPTAVATTPMASSCERVTCTESTAHE